MLVVVGLGFFGFSKLKNDYSSQGVEQTSVSDKQGTTIKTGKITSSQGKFYLTEAGSIQEEIDSMTVELSNYVGKTVTVEGKYSGDTLFVGAVK